MTDEKDKRSEGQGSGPLEPFPSWPQESPFPPLNESVSVQRQQPRSAPALPVQSLSPVTNPNGPPDPPSDWLRAADAHDLPVTPEHRRDANAFMALGRFAFPPGPAPDAQGLAARDRRWTSRAILTAAVFLLVFNAVSPLNWARQQPPGWLPQTVERLSAVWVDQLSVMRADDPRQGLRDLWNALRDARFIGQEPAPARDDGPAAA